MAAIDADMRLLLEWVFENALDEDKSGFIEALEQAADQANRVAKYVRSSRWQAPRTARHNRDLEHLVHVDNDAQRDGHGRASKNRT